MRKYTLIIFFLISFKASYSQTDVPTTVYTCKGGSVAALVRSEFSQSDIIYYTNYTSSTYNYLGITIIGNASRQYNCHSYAWHLTEGNTNKVWINNTNYQYPVNGCFPENNNIHKYWTDGCFIQVCNEADADKAHYSCGDHSAVKSTTNPGYYESKWGQLALVRHLRTSVPYATTNINYYASTKISGDASNLCTGTRIFSVKNISGATYSWTKSSNLSVVGSGNSYQYSVQRNGSANGAAWVEVQISTSCSPASSTQRINFGVGAPAPPSPYVYADWDNPLKIIAGADAVTGATSYKWYVNNVYIKSTTNPNTSLPYNGDCYTSVTVGVEVVTACGTSGKTNTNIGTAPCGNFYIIAPNPAQNTITITTGDQRSMTAKADASSSPTNGIAQIKIYNSNGIVLKSVQYNETRKQVQMNVADIAEGLYFIEVSNGNNKQTKKLIIAR